ncbi:MAG: PAS domain S-box protein [Dehalococcoidia bacterium]|nr:PAS domain S-box protein [Dehalococcoidia bacterium]
MGSILGHLRPQSLDWLVLPAAVTLAGLALVALDLALGSPVESLSPGRPALFQLEVALVGALAVTTYGLIRWARALSRANAHLNEAQNALVSQNEHLAALHETSMSLLNEHDDDDVLHAILTRVCKLLDTKHAHVSLVQPGDDVLAIVLATGIFEPELGRRIARGEGAVGRAWESARPLAVNDYPRWPDRIVQRTGPPLAAMTAVPIISKRLVIGMLGVGYLEEGRRFTSADLTALDRFATLTAVALENARLNAALQGRLADLEQTGAALRDSDERFQLVARGTRDVVFDWDTRRQVSLFGGAIRSHFGYNVSDVDLGWCVRHIHPEDVRVVWSSLKRSLASGNDWSQEFRFKNANGDHADILGRGTVIRDNEGKAIRMVGSMVDISDRAAAERALQASEERFRELFENASDAIYTVDLEGRVTSANGACAELMGMTTEELLGTRLDDFVPSEERRKLFALRHRSRAEGRAATELETTTKRGRIRLEVTTRMIYADGKPVGRQGIARDISERVQRQQRDAVNSELSLALAEAATVQDGLQKCVDTLTRHTDLAYARIWTLDVDNMLIPLASSGFADLLASVPTRIAVGKFKVGMIARDQRPHVTHMLQDDDEAGEWAAGWGMTSFAGYPIMVDNRLLGVFTAFGIHRIDQVTLDLLQGVVDRVATLIARKRSDDAVRRVEHRMNWLVQNASDVIIIRDRDAVITYLSPSIKRVLGYDPEEIIGTTGFHLMHPEDMKLSRKTLDKAMTDKGGTTTPFTLRYRHRDGTWRHLEGTVTNLLDDPDVRGMVTNVRDVSERVLFEDKLRQQAFYDGLTGLANRSLFMHRLDDTLTGTDEDHREVALLFLDLDGFKQINDSLGHRAGDEVLKVVADRLRGCVRTRDCPARFGGDEFAVLLDGVKAPEDVFVITDRLLLSLAAPINVDHHVVHCAGSIGIAFGDFVGATSDDLLRRADTALYTAKNDGKGRYAVYGEGGSRGPRPFVLRAG